MKETSLKLKLLNGFYRYVSGSDNPLPLFHGNDIPEFVRADDMIALGKRGAISLDHMSDYNMSDMQFSRLVEALCHDRRLNVSGIGMMKNSKLVAMYHKEPYKDCYRHVSYSMCKSVVQMAIGIAYYEGLLSLDEKISDIFPEHDGIFMKKGMKDVTVEHLLTMRAGVKFDELSSFFHRDWCRSYMGSELSFAPGTEFTYNSLNSYMLAAIIKEKTGRSLLTYLQEKLFDAMDIHDITWDKCPQGIEKGGWGMKLSLIDMLKLGQLYIDKGVYNSGGRSVRLIPEAWIERSVRAYTSFDDKNCIAGYGYHIWLLNDGAYLFNGLFGQNVYISPKRQLVIATIASAYEFFPDGRLVSLLCDYVADEKSFKADGIYNRMKNQRHYARYETCGLYKALYKSTAYVLMQAYIRKNKDVEAYKYIYRLMSPYRDIEYRFEEYATSILPIATQMIYSIYNEGIKSIKLQFEDRRMYLCIEDSGVKYRLCVGYSLSIPYEYQLINIKGKELPIAINGSVCFDDEHKLQLRIKIVYLEEVSDKLIYLQFEDNGLRLRAYETPGMLEFSDRLIGEEKMRRTKILTKIQPPDYIKYKLNRVFEADVVGKEYI